MSISAAVMNTGGLEPNMVTPLDGVVVKVPAGIVSGDVGLSTPALFTVVPTPNAFPNTNALVALNVAGIGCIASLTPAVLWNPYTCAFPRSAHVFSANGVASQSSSQLAST